MGVGPAPLYKAGPEEFKCGHTFMNPRLFPSLCALYFFATLVAQLHGFSLTSWGKVLGDPTLEKPLFGRPRDGRSDDWMALLPAALSQSQHKPPFSAMNTLVHPNGQNMRLGISMPTNDWSMIFKPTLWGYYVSPDFGISWHWQFRIFILLLGGYFFFVTFLGACPLWASFGALALLHSSFFTYWSFTSEPITGFALLVAVLSWRLLQDDASIQKRLGLSLLLLWSMNSFCLAMLYPPFQIPLGYFVGGALIAKIAHRRTLSKNLFWVAGTLLFASVILVLHFYENRETLARVLSTEYPGRRFSTGGDLSPQHLSLMSLLALSGYSTLKNFNIAEAGNSFLVGLGGLLAFALSFRKSKALGLGSYLAIATAGTALYSFVGLPAFAAKLTGFSMVPGPRMLGLWTLLNVSWLVWWLEHRPTLSRRKGFALVAVIAFVFTTVGYRALAEFSQLSQGKLVLAVSLMTLISYLLLQRPRWGAGLTLAVLIFGSVTYNPIDRKNFARIITSSVSSRLREDFARSGKSSVLLLDNDFRTANFPRMVGVPSLGGMHFVPQLEFWHRFDPAGKFSLAYNRFAHVSFARAEAGAPTSFESPQADLLTVRLSDTAIQELGRESLILERLPKP